jgi:endonuclease/exonuclease/phosphatase family metal-dependent hydrolase
LHGDDAYSKKGILGAKIKVSPTEEIVVFTTHLQSGGSNQAQQTRFAQLRALDALHRSDYCKPDPGNTCLGILTGADFNIGRYGSGLNHQGHLEADPDWEPSRWFFEDANLKFELDLEEDQRGTTWHKGTPFTGWSDNTTVWTRKFNEIDHILAAKCAQIPRLIGSLQIDTAFGICSDHIPVTGRFQIR